MQTTDGALTPVPAASGVGQTEIECMYCTVTVARNGHRTCSECAREMERLFGDRWYEEDWHTLMIADHKRVFDTHATTRQVSIDRATDMPTERLMPGSLPNCWLPTERYREAYFATRDMCWNAHVQGVKIGRVRIHEELQARGIPQVPNQETIRHWLDRIRFELNAKMPDRGRITRKAA